MVIIEFGKCEKINLDTNSLFIKFSGSDFKQNLDRIKGFWNRVCHGKPSWEWEVPYSCFEEIKELYKDCEIKYINEPPKAQKVTSSNITEGLDYNGYDLYDYQLDGVQFGLNHKNFLLLDEQGLGKTLQIISLARYKKEHYGLKHCLIICGVNSLKWNWQREVSKFCKNEKAIVLGTKVNKKGNVVSTTIEETKQQIQSCPEEFFWIINIEKMRLVEDCKNQFGLNDITNSTDEETSIPACLNKQITKGNLGMVVIDECHKCKNLQSAQSKGIIHLDPSVSKVGLSGTLLVNNPYDLYCPMSFVGLINYNKWIFEKKFVIKNDYGQVLGYQNMEDLHNVLYKSSIRRTKNILDLPEKMYKQEWLEFNKEEQRIFDEVTGKEDPKDLDKIEVPNEIMAVITRMRQCTVASELLTTKKVTSTKFERLNDILEEAKINNQKVLVFCPFTEALKLGLEYCKEYKPKLVCGGMGNKVQQVIDEHENSKGFSVLFAQEATLGVGFTLTETSIVVFLSPPWSRAAYDQCIDRTHRIGQKNTVQVIDLLIKDTYDECIYQKLHGKGAMSDVLIDGQEIEALQEHFNKIGIEFKADKIQVLKSPDKLF